MFNVLLDPLPEQWNGIPINTDFRIGVLIYQCIYDSELTDIEKTVTAERLLFGKNTLYAEQKKGAIDWFLNEYDHDNHKNGGSNTKAMDFDVDQWRIYSAFLSQYGINLNTARMHWFVFMGLMGNLEECNFTRVIDIRQKKITSKMGTEEKKLTNEAKQVYALEEPVKYEQKQAEEEAVQHFQKLIGKG